MKAQLDKKINQANVVHAREVREVEGLVYDLSDPFDRALLEAVLIDCIDEVQIDLSEVA